MLALDQRESLRDMFPRDRNGAAVTDDELRSFKRTGIEVLTPHASAILLDRPYGIGTSRPPGLADDCGLIVAVDVLHQVTGEPVTDVQFDDQVTVEFLHHVSADAIKLLVFWRPSSGRDTRAQIVAQTMALAAEAGVASLIEGMVKPDHGTSWRSEQERHAAILACAEELCAFGPDIYKAEVPGYSPGDVSHVAEASRAMSQVVGGEWVVLSNGVHKDMFAQAVAEACAGGASGFLAGRAIWADTVTERDIKSAMSTRSVDRLTTLSAIVDRNA